MSLSISLADLDKFRNFRMAFSVSIPFRSQATITLRPATQDWVVYFTALGVNEVLNTAYECFVDGKNIIPLQWFTPQSESLNYPLVDVPERMTRELTLIIYNLDGTAASRTYAGYIRGIGRIRTM